ncbi:Aminodeoxychorismate synthase, chloroplastic [Frankliniella fusca]|uniref:Aminodeoxychorismate synthase, chloroplastic n=1 Tax=Frankliniella fusca TaxID=407009 RepID=A0AAE1HL21_9NEOP|nr:Aminodeoxychorismate synthase, chloroplastic [Frankliniella fusca]
MSYRQKIKEMNDRAVPIRSNNLPPFVAFKILSAERIENSKPWPESNVVYLDYMHGLKLQYHPDNDYQTFNEREIKEFNTALNSGKKWYAVSYGLVGHDYMSLILSEEEVQKYGVEIFDCTLHKLNATKEEANGYN